MWVFFNDLNTVSKLTSEGLEVIYIKTSQVVVFDLLFLTF